MTQRHFVARWLGALGLILSLVSQGTTSAQTPLAATRQRAEQGDAAAQYHLGFSYDYGLDVSQDDALALAWYRIAADQGHAAARYNLGVMYAKGGQATGLSWRRTGASPRGISRHSRGSRRSKDYVEAHRWFNLAASHVTVTSDEQRFYAEIRDKTAKQMTPAQLAEAQKRAAEWQVAFDLRQDERLFGSASDSQLQ